MEPRSQAEKLMFPRADVSTAGLAVLTAIMDRFPCAISAAIERVSGRWRPVDMSDSVHDWPSVQKQVPLVSSPLLNVRCMS
jgi:hypothetical protein